MMETRQNSFNRCLSLDRTDLCANDINLYPDSYKIFQNTIENAFFKSELLLKCKMEFERLIKVDIQEPRPNTDIPPGDMNLNLVFTGAIKSGRSSIINMFLNTKVMPVNVLGSSCCVKISHPKSSSRQISVGIHDWAGWELDKVTDIDIEDLPKKIEEMQINVLKKSMGKNHKLSKKLHVQLPHWFLKNIDIYKCSPIDGMYSFEEPFDMIQKTKNTILMHVVDASNGLMEWDRTFLSQIQYKLPQLPIFFIINHIDIQYEVLVRDRCVRFGNTPETPKCDALESESDQTSNDEAISEKFTYNEQTITKQQIRLIESSTKQITKLGFALEKSLTIYWASLSVKEFSKMMKKKEKESNFHFQMIEEFFWKFSTYLNAWMEKMLINSSLQLKCQINGVVDAALCHILYPSSLSQDVTSDIDMQKIRKAEKSINETFHTVISDLENQVLKIVKERLKSHEDQILKTIPVLSSEDPTEIIHIIKPVLLKNCETILIGKSNHFNINDEIHKILIYEIDQLEISFQKICKGKNILNFTKYTYNLFRVLRKTFNFPLIVNLPEEIFSGNTKWYKEILRLASRRIRGNSCKPQDLVPEMINDMTILPLIKTALLNLENIQTDIQFFTKKYQETYKAAQNWSTEGSEVFRKLVMVDFIIQVIEKSFQRSTKRIDHPHFQRLTSFYSEFYEKVTDNSVMYKKINIQSFTSLYSAINGLCFKRILRNHYHVLGYKTAKLLPDNSCLISYSRMGCDLYTAIINKTPWSIKNIWCIMTQLVNAVKFLLPHYYYIQIDLFPENILLNRSDSGHYNSFLFPFTETSTSINYNPRSDSHKKFDKIVTAVIFQFGMVLAWMITNDLNICSEIYEKPMNPDLEEKFKDTIRNSTITELKQFPLHETCIQFLFHGSQYDTIGSLYRDLNKYQGEVDRKTDCKDHIHEV